MNLSLLIHTFNGYQHLWKGCIDGWTKYGAITKGFCDASYLGTDLPITNFETDQFSIIYSGLGEWSDRLRILLQQIPSDYILYTQEDHWPTDSPPNIQYLMQLMVENNLFRLQISPKTHFYKVFSDEKALFFDENSKYLVSHQPSIWKKSFLIDCLKPGETPWQNEYKGTLRLQSSGLMRDYIRKKIAIYPCDWYKHMCIKGVLVES